MYWPKHSLNLDIETNLYCAKIFKCFTKPRHLPIIQTSKRGKINFKSQNSREEEQQIDFQNDLSDLKSKF